MDRALIYGGEVKWHTRFKLILSVELLSVDVFTSISHCLYKCLPYIFRVQLWLLPNWDQTPSIRASLYQINNHTIRQEHCLREGHRTSINLLIRCTQLLGQPMHRPCLKYLRLLDSRPGYWLNRLLSLGGLIAVACHVSRAVRSLLWQS